jgi:uncharacterized protein involved in exopolysaccharide biosynthesis
MAEATTLHEATPPDVPAQPIKLYHVLLSGFMALILGIGFAYVWDYIDSLLKASKPHEAMTTA